MNDPRKLFRSQVWRTLSTPGKDDPTVDRQREKKERLREALWNILEYGKGRLGRIVNNVIMVLIIISVIILPLELLSELSEYRLFAEIVEICITAIFTVDYIARIYAAPVRWKYIFSWWGLIDLLSILPYYISLAQFHSQAFRLLRLFRIVRMLKIARIRSSEGVQELVKHNSEKFLGLMQGEEIERVVMQHPLFLVINLLFPILLVTATLPILFLTDFHQVAVTITIAMGLFIILFTYKIWRDHHYDVTYITNYRVIFQDQHLFGRNHISIEYRDIMNILPSQRGIVASILGYGSIALETSSDQSLIYQKRIRDYNKVAQIIHEKCHHHKNRSQGIASPPTVLKQ